eukprot:Hpha_TRINITY_DN11713_c0_g1::TRINITY_DN11713_c0_g1_i1::g.31657::m.31657
MPPKPTTQTDWGDHVWTPRRHKRYDAANQLRASCSPYNPQSIPAPPPERRLVAPAPRPPSASAPGLWEPRGSMEQQHKTMADLLGVDTNKAYCGRFHFSPRKGQAKSYRLKSPYGHHPDHRNACEAGLDMGLIRDHDLPVPGDFAHEAGLSCTAMRRSRSAPPPKDTRGDLVHDDHLIERSVQRQQNRTHGHGPTSYAFNASPAALRSAQALQPSKACTPKPTAAQRSVLTGAGVWVPSRFEGLSIDHKGSSSRRAQTPAPTSLIRSNTMDTPSNAYRATRRLADTGEQGRHDRMNDILSAKYLQSSGQNYLDHSHYGSHVRSQSAGPGRRLYPTFTRSHTTSDLWGATGAARKQTMRKQYGGAGSAPGTPRASGGLEADAPFDRSYTGPLTGGPSNMEAWRPWRRKLRSTSPGPVSAAHSQLMGHAIVNDPFSGDPTSGRYQSPRRPHSFGGSGLSWTKDAQPEATRMQGKSCSLTPERRRVAVSHITGTGAVHDVGPGFNPHQGLRGKNCQSPARPRDSFQGHSMEIKIL